MTKNEIRALYLIAKHAGEHGRCRKSEVAMGMSRIKTADRDRALADLENLELISSAKMPNTSSVKGGSGALVYWLTPAGKEQLLHLAETGQLDPRAAKLIRAGE